MKIFCLFVFLIILIGGVIIYEVPSYRQSVINVFSYSQCNEPLPYSIGSVDARFNLSPSDVQADVQTATDIWSTAEGKQLFIMSPKAQLTVNFVYDQRQSLDTNITQLKGQLTGSDKSLQQQIADFRTQVSLYEQKLATLNATVQKYNDQGGAPQDVYNRLIQQQNELNAEGQALNQRASQLNLSTSDYNANVDTLNHEVDQFNTALSQKPEEGLFDGNSNTITIYFASNHQELIHTLSHEFGHSLGMAHVQDANSIMYPYTNASLIPSREDIQQLTYVCRTQSVFPHWELLFENWVIGIRSSITHQTATSTIN